MLSSSIRFSSIRQRPNRFDREEFKIYFLSRTFRVGVESLQEIPTVLKFSL